MIKRIIEKTIVDHDTEDTCGCRRAGLAAEGLRAIAVSLLLSAVAGAADCDATSVGFTPLSDLGTGSYQGFQGGLYPGGSNTRPSTHGAAGLALAQAIGPLDGNGNADTDGQYVLVSIGMSNTSQEFSTFVPAADADPDKDPRLLLVNGAQGGQTASDIVNPNGEFWTELNRRLAAEGVSASQVAVAWLKAANAAGGRDPEIYRNELQADLEGVIRLLPDKFPNLRLVYLSSRIYAGYATTALNPEPHAYEHGFVVKSIIEKQLDGDPSLNHDSARGAVTAPWLSWGPYLWADGLNPRSDGLVWLCSDLADDGTHPSASGRQKVASMLHDFLRADATAREWFMADAAAPDTVAPEPPSNLVIVD